MPCLLKWIHTLHSYSLIPYSPFEIDISCFKGKMCLVVRPTFTYFYRGPNDLNIHLSMLWTSVKSRTHILMAPFYISGQDIILLSPIRWGLSCCLELGLVAFDAL